MPQIRGSARQWLTEQGANGHCLGAHCKSFVFNKRFPIGSVLGQWKWPCPLKVEITGQLSLAMIFALVSLEKFCIDLRFSNESALCKMEMALPSLKVQISQLVYFAIVLVHLQ